jgi:hypothetical protein
MELLQNIGSQIKSEGEEVEHMTVPKGKSGYFLKEVILRDLRR